LPGNILFVPDNLRGQVNPDSTDGAKVIYTPVSSTRPLAGQNPEPLALNNQQVDPLGKQVRGIQALSDAFYLQKSVLEAKESMSKTETGEIDSVAIELLLNRKDDLDQALKKAGLPPLQAGKAVENLNAILSNPQSSAKLLRQLDADVRANTPPGITAVNEGVLQGLTEQVAAPLKDKLITPHQYQQIFGRPPPAGSIPSDSKGDAPVYLRLRNPDKDVSGNPEGAGLETYQAVQLRNGRTVLAVPNEGTSFSTPIQTGIDSKRITP
jgi:hypothetical protein